MPDDERPIEILIVDDEPSIRMLLKRWIDRSLRANVREASDGMHALEQVSSGDVEMMIADINMPVLDGIEMLRALQTDPSRKRMEVLVASQVANEGKVRQAIALGVSDYLLKPLQHDAVVRRIEQAAKRIYERRRQADQNPIGSRTRVLVADADPNYCDFAESTLSADFSVQTSRTVASTLVKTMRFQPDVLLLNPTIPGLDIDLLLKTVSRASGFGRLRIYELRPKGEATQSKHVTGVLERSFIPETLRSQLLARLRGGDAPDHGVFAWARDLENELRTALFQALGMLTGVEPQALPQPSACGGQGIYGWVDISTHDGASAMRLGLECGADLPRKLPAAMLGEPAADPAETQFSLDAIQEILGILAGRLQSSCVHRKIDVSIGQARTSLEPPQPRDWQFEYSELFRWGECDPFRLLLQAS